LIPSAKSIYKQKVTNNYTQNTSNNHRQNPTLQAALQNRGKTGERPSKAEK